MRHPEVMQEMTASREAAEQAQDAAPAGEVARQAMARCSYGNLGGVPRGFRHAASFGRVMRTYAPREGGGGAGSEAGADQPSSCPSCILTVRLQSI